MIRFKMDMRFFSSETRVTILKNLKCGGDLTGIDKFIYYNNGIISLIPSMSLYMQIDAIELNLPTFVSMLAPLKYAFSIMSGSDNLTVQAYERLRNRLRENDDSCSNIFFKPDGLVMFTLDDLNNAIHQHTLSTAWDLSTERYSTKIQDPSKIERIPGLIVVKLPPRWIYDEFETDDDVVGVFPPQAMPK